MNGLDAPPRFTLAEMPTAVTPTWALSPALIERFDQLDLWDRFDELRTDGYTAIEGFVPHHEVDDLRELVVSELRSTNGAHDRRRRDGLYSVHRRFRELLVDPRQLALADAVCTEAQVAGQSATWRDNSCAAIPLHADVARWLPAPYSHHHMVMATVLTLDDFRPVGSGATGVVPSSHLLCADPAPEMRLRHDLLTRCAVAAGTLLCWLGTTWHGTMPRRDPGGRVSIQTFWTRPFMRPYENVWQIADDQLESDELRRRLRRSDGIQRSSDAPPTDGHAREVEVWRGHPVPGALVLP